ncbi:MAG TPA: hypothetical protein PLZ36_09835, partial [Armatimonadota bacterium]|nr:hypothetical protein [Armatimonadota bacterium]
MTRVLSLVSLLLLVLGASAATKQFIITERLNQQYGAELVSYPFTAAQGQCLPDSLQLAGPNGAVPVQLSAIELWPKTNWVKSGTVSFIVDGLAPLETKTYTLTYGTKAVKRATGDLAVIKTPRAVDVIAGQLAARFPLGGVSYPEPKPAADVPGPLGGLRPGKAAWAGGSRWVNVPAVKSWSATLTDGGPVFARVRFDYAFADGNIVTFIATLAAGDSTARWEMAVKDDRPDQALLFTLPAPPGVARAAFPKGYGQWARERTQALTPSETPFCSLTPDLSIANAFADQPQAVQFAAEGGPALLLRSREPAAWVEPGPPYTYGGFPKWDLEMIPKSWDAWKRKSMPVSYAADGTVTLKATLAKGRRVWTVTAGAPAVGDRLRQINGYVLDWPASPRAPKHPHLFVDAARIQDTWARADAELKRVLAGAPSYAGTALAVLMKPAEQRTPAERDRVVGQLRAQLALLGNFDVMRGAIGVTAMYDALIDSDLVTPEERALFRAQMAYLGYVMADPSCWEMERGAHSGNPNMSVSYTLSLGVIACALPDHPMAKTWAARATGWMNHWLATEVGANGEWVCEGSHYGYVSLEPMITYAIAAKRAGFHDFSTDARFKKLLLYFARYHTPRDVQRKNERGIGAYGRGHSGDRLACFGVAAPLFAEADPALSRALQWLWAENGYPYFMGDNRLGGFEPYYADRRLPMAAPAWGSELFPELGALLRHGFNTPNESYLNVISHAQSLRNLDIWTPGIGGIAQWFALGRPMSTCFTFDIGYNERHELLRDGVRLARNWGAPGDPKTPFGHYTATRPGAFAAQPAADYVRTTLVNTTVDDRDWFPANMPAFPTVTPAAGTNLEWTRQLLFLKDADPAGTAYLVLRDATRGGQPTAWQFWTKTEKIGTPAQAADRAAFLADKPGYAILPARALPMSDRYTAPGQFDVDIEYFIASPANTPRHTLRYGGMWAGNRVYEYQDLLHLQLPGDGAYYVAIVPRTADAPAPTFTKLADGAIIKVSRATGADYAFLATDAATAEAEGAAFAGTAAAVQIREGEIMLTLAAAGSVRYREYGLDAGQPAT